MYISADIGCVSRLAGFLDLIFSLGNLIALWIGHIIIKSSYENKKQKKCVIEEEKYYVTTINRAECRTNVQVT